MFAGPQHQFACDARRPAPGPSRPDDPLLLDDVRVGSGAFSGDPVSHNLFGPLQTIPRKRGEDQQAGNEDERFFVEHPQPDDHGSGAHRGLLPRLQVFPIFHRGADFLQQHDDQTEDDTDRAGVAHFLVDERLAQHEQRGHVHLAARSALESGERDDHPGVDDRADDGEHQHQVNGAGDQRQFNAGEFAPPADAIDIARFVDVLADALQLREVGEDGERANPWEPPDDHRGHQQPRIAQPRRFGQAGKRVAPAHQRGEGVHHRVQVGELEKLVQVSIGRLKEKRTPDQCDDQRGNHHRDDEQQPVHILQFFAATPVNAHRDEQGHDHLKRVGDAEGEGVFKRVPEFRRRQQVDVVLPADRLGHVRPVPAKETVEDAA